jgi:hypothetical protein
VRLDSDPAGASLSLDGASLTAPASALAVVGHPSSVGAPESFDRDGRRWLFGSWSDGGAREHGLTVAAGDPLLTASFAGEPLPAPVIPAQPGPPEPPHPQPHTKHPPRLALPSRGLRLSRTGRVSFKLVNPEPAVWRGQVAMATTGKVRVAGKAARRITFARGSLVVAGKAKRVLRLRLSRISRRLVARLRRVRVTITLTPQGGKPLEPGLTVLLPPRR